MHFSCFYPFPASPELLTREIYGLKLAFPAFDDILAPLDDAAAVQAIQSTRADGRLVIVSINSGTEYIQSASGHQKAMAKQFADAGAIISLNLIIRPGAQLSQ